MKITSFINIRKLNEKNIIENKNMNGEESTSGFESLGIKKTNENLKIYKTLIDNEVEPTKEMVEDIRGVFEKLDGTLEEKIKSLDILVKKDIEITVKNIRIVHQSLTKNIDYDKLFDNLNKYFEDEEIDYDKLLKKLGFSEKIINEFLLNKTEKFSLKDNLIKIYDDKDNTLDEIEKTIISDVINDKEKIEKEVEFQIEDIFDDFERNISEVINEIKDDVPYEIGELIDTNNFRSFLVETTTKEMVMVKEEFEVFKKENIKLIDKIVLDLDENKNFKNNDLSKVIKNFEKVIMKSDITLYTSMKQEKELIKLVSKLELSKEYLDKNDYNKAKRILIDVKKELDKIDFHPKDIKVKAFMEKEVDKILFPEKNNVKALYNTFSKKNKGVRETLELLRGTGVNHDSEIAQKIEKSDYSKLEESNLKDIILNIAKSNGGELPLDLKSTITNITGNQFQNKLEVKSNFQQMHLLIPYDSNSKIKSLDLYIKSKKESEKIDWKNSTLYFVINLKKYGKTGIRISSSNKIVNMNIKNDNEEFHKNSIKMFNEFIDGLAKEGFIKGKVNYSKFVENSKDEVISEVLGINISEKGFDVKI
jgi:hypothetical protein